MQRQKSFENDKATLYLVATPIGNLEEITFRAINILKQVNYIAAEDTRNTIKLLNYYDIKAKLISHHEHNLGKAIPKILNILEEGNDVALVSDAGYPAISDPGYELVKATIKKDFNVVVISGPNACINALVVSGLVPQPFLFYGFLSHQESKKKKELEALKTKKETIVFYESPHRYKKTLKQMLTIFGNRNIALVRELTKRHEEIIRATIQEVLEINDIKGELVLVVEGNKEDQVISFDFGLVEHVELLIDSGMTSKEAIKEVAKLRGIPKNEVYKAYHHN